ncbi:MAG: choice-of-anchor tandem repeat NxxGxxAF-containing protein [Lysobacterales bacterium]
MRLHFALHLRNCVTSVLTLLTCAPVLAGETVPFTVDTEILVRSGQPSPDGNGVFGDNIGRPVLNNAGQAAFIANLLATSDPDPIDDLGLYRASTTEQVTLARGGQASAAGNQLDLQFLQLGTLGFRTPFGIDASGSVGFISTDSESEDAIYRADGTDLQAVLQSGQDTPFGESLNVGPSALGFLVNDAGQLAYLVNSSTQNLLVRSDGLVTQPVFASGQALPNGNTLTALRAFGLNNAGEIVARLNISNDDFGHFVGDLTSVRQINQTGAAAPDGLGTFVVDPRLPADLNSQSEVALAAGVDDITEDYVGVYLDQGMGLEELTRSGNPTLGGDLLGLISGLNINDRGDLLYLMIASDNTRIQRLLLRRDGAERLVISEGDVVSLDVQGSLIAIRGFTLNEAGQVLVNGTVQILGEPQRAALFLYDPQFGLAEVARAGQPLAGGTLQVISPSLPQFPLEPNTLGNAQTSFNDQGQVAYAYVLTNGERGIALAEVTFERPDLIFKDSFESLSP